MVNYKMKIYQNPMLKRIEDNYNINKRNDFRERLAKKIGIPAMALLFIIGSCEPDYKSSYENQTSISKTLSDEGNNHLDDKLK